MTRLNAIRLFNLFFSDHSAARAVAHYCGHRTIIPIDYHFPAIPEKQLSEIEAEERGDAARFLREIADALDGKGAA